MTVGDRFAGQRPETFGWLEFRGVGGQDVQLDAFGNLKVRRDVPSGTVDDEQHGLVGTGAEFCEGSKDGAEQGGVDGVGSQRSVASPDAVSASWLAREARNQTTAPVVGLTKP